MSIVTNAATAAGEHSPEMSFSIIIETENLAIAGPGELIDALTSLSLQTLPPDQAEEVVILNSGDVPAATLAEVERRFPWVQWHSIGADSDYYDAKVAPIAATRGDILVFFDCDCRYAPEWLHSIVTTIRRAPTRFQLVAGETAIKVETAYDLLNALAYAFPPHSQKNEPYPMRGYPFNNVAFQRRLLEQYPIPTGYAMYRGNCTAHARNLLDAGITIWCHPGARAFHPDLLPSHILPRFFMWGHHDVRIAIERRRGTRGLGKVLGLARESVLTLLRRFIMFFWRIPRQARDTPRKMVWLPVALIGFLGLYCAYVAGALVTLVNPSVRMTRLGQRLEQMS